MELKDFVKEVFNQESAEGYQLECVEISVIVRDGKVCIVEDGESVSSAKITITPSPNAGEKK